MRPRHVRERGSGDSDGGLDASDGVGRLIVLPDSQDRPAGGLQSAGRALVTLGVRAQLRSPVVDVASGDGAVDRAAVPEAPIDVDSEPEPWKYDVWSREPARGSDWMVDVEAQSTAVKCTAQAQLRGGVAPTIGLHRRCRGAA